MSMRYPGGYIAAEKPELYGALTINQKTNTPLPFPNEDLYNTPGTYSWVAPANVSSISVVCVGGGGGGSGNTSMGGGAGGGGLGYLNNIRVTPGQAITVQVGASGIGNGVSVGVGTAGGDSYLALVDYTGGIPVPGTPADVQFSADGLTMYVLINTTNAVYQYTLSTPWAASTAVITSANSWNLSSAVAIGSPFRTATQDATPRSVFFKPDGLKMFMLGSTTNDVYEYVLSTAWDQSTAVLSTSYAISSDATAKGLFFKSDGTKMYIVGSTTDTVYEYNLGTAWTVTGATQVGSFSVSAQSLQPQSLAFKPDGLKMYVLDLDALSVDEYNLSTAWSVTTAVFSQTKATALTTPVNGLFFKSDGTKMYVGSAAATCVIREYSLSTAWDISTATTVTTLNIEAQENSISGIFISTDGSILYTTGDGTIGGNGITSYGLYNKTTLPVGANPTGISFKPDGTRMYVSTASSFYEYSLSTPWLVSSLTLLYTKVVSSTDSAMAGFYFKSDGTKLYMAGNTGDRVFEFNCYKVVSIAAQDATVQSIAFKSDGTKMYAVGATTDAVYEYNLSTAWDIDSISYLQSFSVAAQDTAPSGITFKSDGTKMYVVGALNDAVYEYDLSTAWNISSATYLRQGSVSPETTATGVFFKSDGTEMYVCGTVFGGVISYALSTAWDVSTAVVQTSPWLVSSALYANQTFSVTTQDTAPNGIAFKSDGTKMYVVGATNDSVYEYNLSTAWNVTSAVIGATLSVATYEIVPEDLFFKADGTELYILGSNGDDVTAFTLSTPWSIATAAIKSGPWAAAGALYTTKSFTLTTQDTAPRGSFFKDDGLQFYTTGLTGDEINQYALTIAWDISTAAFVRVFSVAAQDTAPQHVSFKSDGTKMYVLGVAGNDVNEYALSTAWNISTSVFTTAFAIPQIGSVQGMDFKSDGTEMTIIGTANSTRRVCTFSLSTPWSVATASYKLAPWEILGIYGIRQSSLSTGDTAPKGIFFKPDGTRYYVVGDTGNEINAYSLSTAWDVSTSVLLTPFSVAAKETGPKGVSFKTDGTVMYVVGSNSNAVHSYALSTAWDITTSVFVATFSVNAQANTPLNLYFKTDGTAFYIVNASAFVYEYTLSTAWDISTAVYANKSFSVFTQQSAPTTVYFKDDGTRMFIAGTTGNNIVVYTLSTAWDITTASLLDQIASTSNLGLSFGTPVGMYIASNGTDAYFVSSGSIAVFQTQLGVGNTLASFIPSAMSDLAFKSDGTKMYVTTGSALYELNLTTAWNVLTITSDSQQSPSLASPAGNVYSVTFKPDGTQFYIVGDTAAYQYAVNSVYTVVARQTDPTGMFFSADGINMYVVGATSANVSQYLLSTAWNVTTATYVRVRALSIADPRAVSFNSTGTRMFVLEQSATDRVHTYALSTAWDISTAVDINKPFTQTNQTVPTGMTFKTDGTTMYLIGTTGAAIYAYTLLDGIRTALLPTDVIFKPDGTKMYITNNTNDRVDAYNLSVAWDVTTAVFLNSKSVVRITDSPQGLSFNDDGTRLYVTGSSLVVEYVLSTAWDVSTALEISDPWNIPGITYESVSVLVSAITTDMGGVSFKTDGTRMYITGSANAIVAAYDLSTPWLVSSATWQTTYSTASKDSIPSGITFQPDGSQMYITGDTYDRVYQYDLGANWYLDQVYGYGGGGGDGASRGLGGTYIGAGGGAGGNGGNGGINGAGGSGGAGGYTAAGGAGADGINITGSTALGGGGGGGGTASNAERAGGGGGTGVFGLGTSGVGGGGAASGSAPTGGGGGSNGENAYLLAGKVYGGNYGGGGASVESSSLTYGDGGKGVVRIIWGTGRAFPATDVGVS